MSALLHDLRCSLRLFLRSPGFTATAVLVLAIGIGVTSAAFTVINALFLKPLGGSVPGELVGIYSRDRTPGQGYRAFSYPNYREIRDDRVLFSSVMAQHMAPVGVTAGDTTRRTFAAFVSSNFFSTLGVQPALGRPFEAAEEGAAAPPTVIVSFAYWKALGRDPQVLGRVVRINALDLTIVGVAPEGFSGTVALFSPEFWLPLGLSNLATRVPDSPGGFSLADRNRHFLMLAGRLRPGVTREASAPRLADLASRMEIAWPIENRNQDLVIGDLSRLTTSSWPADDGEVGGVVMFLMAMAGVVLLIACLNLANMLLARGGARRKEMAIRLALGGGRPRIVRQLLTESMLLALAGAGVGLIFAVLGTRVLAGTLGPIIPLVLSSSSTPDWRVVTAAVVFSIVSTLIFGLGPAVNLAGTDVNAQMKNQAGPASARGRNRYRLNNLLVVSQLAMSLALLSAGGLFVRGAVAAARADPGFSLDRGIVATVDPSLAGYDEQRGRATYRQVVGRLRALPAIESASLASAIPFGVSSDARMARRPEQAGRGQDLMVITTIVGARYFGTVGLPVLRGREFTDVEEESANSAHPVIIDETLARKLWPGVDPLGRLLQLETEGRGWSVPGTVVGVVAGVRQSLFDTAPVPCVYLPFGSEYRGEMSLHARLRPGRTPAEAAVLQAVRRELRIADEGLPVLAIRTLRDHRDTSIYMWIARAGAAVFIGFGVSALLLAVLGVYGVKAYLVTRRTREIGIRMALGATRLDVLRLVVRDGLGLTLAGLIAGLAFSIILSRLLASWIYGVSGLEPTVLAGAAALLTGSALLACYMPARRATRLAPSVALRSE